MTEEKQLSAGSELDAAVDRAMGQKHGDVLYYSTSPLGCSLAKKWLESKAYEWAVHFYADRGRTYRAEQWHGGDGRHAYGSTEEEAIARLVLAVAEAM